MQPNRTTTEIVTDSDETVERIQKEAVDIANAVEAILKDRNTVAAYTALGMVIGHNAAHARNPDLPGLLKIVKRVARGEYADQRKRLLAEAEKAAADARGGGALQ